MTRWLGLLPVALIASAAQATFHPIQDRPYRYDSVETRSADGVERRFQSKRTVVFHQTDRGFTAIVTLVMVDHQNAADVAQMFATATESLLDRPLRFALGPDGSIEGVEDADAAIAQIAMAIERMAIGTRRPGMSTALAAPLRAMPPERKVAMLTSIVSPLLAGHLTDRLPGKVAVTLPSRPPLAPGMALSGTETVRHAANGQVTIETEATGNVDASSLADSPGKFAAGPVAAPSVTTHSTRRFDSTSGLLVESTEASDVIASDGRSLHRTRTATVITVTPPA